MKRILFLHPNFPGQFVRPALQAAKQGNDVKFICHTHFGRKLSGVERVALKGPLSQNSLNELGLKGNSKTLALAKQFQSGMELIKSQGWEPDLIVSHSGFGCGLHSNCVWPNAYKIAYVEWWFAANSILSKYDPNNTWWAGPSLSENESLRERNLSIALELIESELIVSPTEWQKNQMPLSLQQRCKILPDGVDTNRFRPNANNKSQYPLITYGTRGMEAMRGFPEFILELPAILETNKAVKIEIAGEDEICYGGRAPEEGSYGKWAAKKLQKWIEEKRVVFVGRLSPAEYQRWLQRSWIHIHLTRPFVASWSLLEAMASGCSIVATDTEPVQEFLKNEDCIFIDQRKPGWLIEPINRLLESKEEREKLGLNARRQSENWSEPKSFQLWDSILISRQSAD